METTVCRELNYKGKDIDDFLKGSRSCIRTFEKANVEIFEERMNNHRLCCFGHCLFVRFLNAKNTFSEDF